MNDEEYQLGIRLGDTLRDSGALVEAVSHYEKLERASPNFALGPYKLGTALARLGRSVDAEAAYRRAIALLPDFADAHYNLAILLSERNESSAAEFHFRCALQHQPDYFGAVVNLGQLLAGNFRLNEAVVLLTGYSTHQACSLGNQLTLAGMLFQWQRPFDGATLLASALKHGRTKLSSNSIEIAETARIFTETGCFDGIRALGDIFGLVEGLPDDELKNFLLRMISHAWTYEDNIRLRNLYRRHNDALEREVEASGGRHEPWNRLTDPEISVGFLGSLFHANNTAKFLLPVLPHLTNRGFRLVYFSTIGPCQDDPVQQKLITLMDAFEWVHDLSPRQVAQRVADMKCTILIDLDGFSLYSKTEAFAFRPAPIQINWINWPTSLGLDSADYFLGSTYMVPPDLSLMSEKPISMSTPYGAYTPMLEAEVSPMPPSVNNGFITFGNASQPYKLSPRLIQLWSDVLARVPGSKFRIVRHECAQDAFCEMVAAEFWRCGISPDRLEFFDFDSLGISHLDAYGSLDICLDSAAYGGATTAADCLWMGVPLASLVGPGLHQRLSYAILAAVGLAELACSDEATYVERAVSLAADTEKLKLYRKSLRAQFQDSPLCNAEGVAHEVVRALNFALEDTRKRVFPDLAQAPYPGDNA